MPQLFSTIDLCEELFYKCNYKITYRSASNSLLEGANEDWKAHIFCDKTNLIISIIDAVYGNGHLIYDDSVDLMVPGAINVLENILESGSEHWGCIRGCLEPEPIWSEASADADIPNLYSKMNHSMCSGNCSNEPRSKE